MNAPFKLPTGPQVPTDGPQRRMSKRLLHAVDLLVFGYVSTIQDAATQAGMSREGLSKALTRVHVQEYRKRREEQARELLDTLSLGTLLHLVANAKSEHVRMGVALKVRARDFGDASTVVNIDQSVGYIVNLSGAPVMPHHETIDAKPLETLNEVGSIAEQRADGAPHNDGEGQE